ncbi:caspase family protein [Hyphobacterium sp. CCMP332]|nr:caspase family protein [Hyphobacterium sp. CCMP332]
MKISFSFSSFFYCVFLSCGHILAQEAELIVPKGHTTPVVLIDYHNNERWLASSQGNNSYTIWNFDAEKEIRQSNFHNDPISALAFHPDFAQLLSADGSGRVLSYDIRKNRKRSDRQIHKGKVNGLVFGKNAETFYTYSDDSTVKEVNYAYFKIVQDISFEGKISSIAAIDEGKLLLVALKNGHFISIDEKGKKTAFKNDQNWVINEILIEDKTHLGICQNGVIIKIDLLNKSLTYLKKIPFKVKKAVVVDSILIIAGRGPTDITFLNAETLDPLIDSYEFQLRKDLDPYNLSIQTIEFDPDSNVLFIPDYDYSIGAYSFDKKRFVRRFQGFTERIKDFDIAPNAQILSLASSKNGIRLYDLREIQETRVLSNSNPAFRVDFSNSGLNMALVKADSLVIYNTVNYEPRLKFPLTGIYPNGNTCFVNDRLLLKKDENNGISLFNIENKTKSIINIKEAFEVKADEKGNLFCIKSGNSKIYLYDAQSQKRISKIKAKDIIDFDFFQNGERVLLISNDDGIKIKVFSNNGKLLSKCELPENYKGERIKVIESGNKFLSWKISVDKKGEEADYSINLWSVDSLQIMQKLEGLQSTITEVQYDAKRDYVIASSEDGSLKIWSLNKLYSDHKYYPASIYPLEGEELVTMLNNGVYDASRSAMEDMHYVQGSEYISLDQIKEKYYEPKLLSKIFGYNIQPIQPRSAIEHFELYPEIRILHPAVNGGILGVDLQERGGGIGKVDVFINNKKAKEFSPSEDLIENQIQYKVESHPFLIPNEINEISVKVSNAAGDLKSSPERIKYIWNTNTKHETQKFYALIIGVSDYTGTKLDLNFSSKDAKSISEAIQNGASNYFGQANVEIVDLNSINSESNLQPTKENTLKALYEISKKINPQDVFLFYFAGHGAQGKEDDKNYYLLTKEASYQESKSLNNPSSYSISDKELGESLSKISSLNMVMILDACHSGEMIDKFNNQIGHLSTKEEKALEKLISETGLHILAGSESDNVSYETSLYGQGLLTYSLLFGMKGDALRDGQYLDVNRLFQYASAKVPELASNVGSVQKPVVKVPEKAGKVDIGEYGNREKAQIKLISPRPIILKSSFQEEHMFLDYSKLGLQLDDELKYQVDNKENDFIFINSDNFTGAYKFNGRYSYNSGEIKIQVKLFKDTTLLEIIEVNEIDFKTAIEKIALRGLGIIEKDFSK